MTTAASAQLANAIAERLLDADDVADGISTGGRGSLSGLAGTALLHARLSAVDDRFAAAAVEHWNRAAAHTRRDGSRGNGTFSGLGSVAASLISGSPYLPDPRQLHDQCAAAARWLCAEALATAEQHHDSLQAGEPPASWAVYDVICGLAGVGRILMTAVDQGHQDALPGLEAALRTLTTMIRNRTGKRPGWWLPSEAHPAITAIHPSGAAATGVAHGIAGPLALLAVALKAGHTVPDQDSAIRIAADWLLRWRDPATDTWPPHITGRDLDNDICPRTRGRRDAWCYGTPGISAALAQAADALNEDKYRVVAHHAMQTLAERDPRSWDVEGPTLCHGLAGILQVSSGYPSLAAEAAAQIETTSEAGHRYLIQHSEHRITADDPGLLTGAAGVALALADYAGLPSYAPPSTQWDSILLLS